MSRKILLVITAALLILLAGCGKEKEPETQPPPPPLPEEMVFEPVSQTVTAKDETNLRNHPSQGELSTVLFTLQNGQTAHRTGISDSGWSRLEYEETVCYAVSSYLTTDLDYKPATEEDDGIQTEFTPVRKIVTAKDSVNLRSIPSVTSEESQVLFTLKNGDTADCVGISESGWAKLSYNGTICYAVFSYLTEDLNYKPSTNSAPTIEDGIETEFTEAQGTVTAKELVNLRSIPSVTSADSKVIAQLKNGETAQRTGISDNGWTRLEYQGQVCYAVSSYLVGYGEDAPAEEDDGEIKTQFVDVNERMTAKDEVNLRTIPSVTAPRSEVVKKLKNGEVVVRTGINSDLGWSRVEFEGQVLYCVSAYLTRLN